MLYRGCTVDVPLFDVVPWTHGYAHSWALRWMVANDELARDRLLGVFLPEGDPPWSVGNMTCEFKVGHNRADPRFDARDSAGGQTAVLIETKVNDALKERQIEGILRHARGGDPLWPGPDRSASRRGRPHRPRAVDHRSAGRRRAARRAGASRSHPLLPR